MDGVSPSAMALIVDKGYDPVYGARPIKRVIQRLIEDKISEMILRGEIVEDNSIYIDAKCGEFIFDLV